MIPNKIHFIFGLKEDFGGKPFSLTHYIAIASAKKQNPNCDIFIHCNYLPQNNEWWDRIKNIATIIKTNSPTHLADKELTNFAHSSDALRLDILLNEGGIYLDLDTICIKPFDPLMNYPLVMGIESLPDWTVGLCNAVILSEPNTEFLNIWKDSANKWSGYWNDFSVKMPYNLSKEYPHLIHIEPRESFFKFLWDDSGLSNMFEKKSDISDCYSLHLWETLSWDKYLKDLTPDQILKQESTYTSLAVEYL